MIQDAINDWSDGATGSITYNGVTTNYEISSSGTAGAGGNLRLDDGESATISFDDPLPGLIIRVGDLDAAFREEAQFEVNGTTFNLEQAIINGDVIVTQGNGTPLPNNGLDVVNGTILDGTPGAQNEGFRIQFKIPISEITLNYLSGGSGLLGFDALVCFAGGVQIETRDGARAVEDLAVGDSVRTLDHGYQKIRWIGRRRLDGVELAVNPKLRPICIDAGALGPGLPSRDLRVSPQHRILARSKIARRMFGVDEVLIPAKKLLPLEGVHIDTPAEGIEYYHILFDRHEIVFSNGSPTESLFTGPEALKSLSPAALAEIHALFPEIARPDFHPLPARDVPVKGRRMTAFAQRHQANHKPLCATAVPSSDPAAHAAA